MSVIIPQTQAIDLALLNEPASVFFDWKQLLPTEQAQAIFAANLSKLAYPGTFNTNAQEIYFGSDRALITSFVYGASFFYVDRFGTINTDPKLFAPVPNVINPLNPSSIPTSAVLMLVCTFNNDRRTNELYETLHAFGFEGFVVAQPGISNNTTALPQVQSFTKRNYFISFRGSLAFVDFTIEYAPSREFSLDLENAVPVPIRSTHLFYANNANKLYKNLLDQNARNTVYNNPFYPLELLGNTHFQKEVNEIVVSGHSLGGAVARCFVQLVSNVYPPFPVPTIQNTGIPFPPSFNFTGDGLNYKLFTFGTPPTQILPFNRNIVNQGSFNLNFVPVVIDRHFVNNNDPIPNVDIPSLRFIDGLPRIRLFNETRGYYHIRPLTGTFTTIPGTTMEIRKISFFNYIDISLIALLSTEHAIDMYITNLTACDVNQFQFEVTAFFFDQVGEQFTPDRTAILLNVLSRVLPQNYFLPITA